MDKLHGQPLLPDPASAAHRAVMTALVHGLLMNEASGRTTHAPFTLLPSPVPAPLFEAARRLGPLFNTLVDAISRDFAFLTSVTESVTSADPFTAKLLQLHKDCVGEGLAQPLQLGIHRSDYMLHADPATGKHHLRQIEINTISSAFPTLATITARLHKHLVRRLDLDVYERVGQLPENDAIAEIPAALAAAHKAFADPSAVVVMVVQPGEKNSYDQQWIEHFLFETHGVRLLRRSLADIARDGVFDADSKVLTIDGSPVAVAYFRAGYTPNDYPTQAEWDARRTVERSTAIKCPSVAYQLVGTKKMQQVLAEPGVLERYLPSAADANLLRSCFAGLYSLQPGSKDDKALADAKAHPGRYVLKPQREGGGNNLYDDELAKVLATASDDDLAAYILMERVFPPLTKGYIMRAEQCVPADLVGELGIYGVFLGSSPDKPLLNKSGGHLLRSKDVSNADGGVAAGVAVLDSPVLV